MTCQCEKQCGSALLRVGEDAHAGQSPDPGLQPLLQSLLVRVERLETRDDPLPPVRGLVALPGERGEEVDRGGRAGHQFVGQGAELEALRHVVGGRRELVDTQVLEDCRIRRDHAAVRAEELVGRARPEVGPERLAIHALVGGRVDAIDPEQAADRMDLAPHRADRRSRADEVGGAVIATSRVRSPMTASKSAVVCSPVSGSKPAHRTVAPTARLPHGRTLLSWSAARRRHSSPGPIAWRAPGRGRIVIWVALRPTMMPPGHCRADRPGRCGTQRRPPRPGARLP